MINLPREVWEMDPSSISATSEELNLMTDWLPGVEAEYSCDTGEGRRRKKLSNVDRGTPLRLGVASLNWILSNSRFVMAQTPTN